MMDSRFLSLYYLLGGEEILGSVISPVINIQGIDFQFTTSALFEYNPALPPDQQVKLSPIGLTMGIADHFGSLSDPDQEIEIYPGFSDFYTQLGGESFAGAPITSILYNEEKSRVEQHFENLGFYQLDSDTSNQVHLLHYGVWLCADLCDFSTHKNSEVVLFSETVQPFIDKINTLSPEAIGRPLTNPQIAHDGNIEQIFQNVVFTVSPNNLDDIQLRPIPSILGLPIQPGIAHEIPVLFIEYLEENLLHNFAGAVVTPLTRMSDHLYRQCFKNLCLDYFPINPEDEKIRPVPLGYLYRNRYYRPSESRAEELQTIFQAVNLTIWEEYPLLPPNTSQIIGVTIYKDQIPLENIQPDLILRLPERISITFSMPPTQVDGTTSLTLFPIDAPHGTVISYDVCVNLVNEVQTCQSENFIVWGNP